MTVWNKMEGSLIILLFRVSQYYLIYYNKYTVQIKTIECTKIIQTEMLPSAIQLITGTDLNSKVYSIVYDGGF